MAKYLQRFNTVLLRELHEVLRREYGPQTANITLIAAEVSSDLNEAKIFYSAIGDKESQSIAKKNLTKWSRSLRHGLAASGFFKIVPKLTFIKDDSIERSSAVTRILDEL